MFAWLSANLINIVLIAVIALTVGFLIHGMIRDKKAGKSSCGGKCANCGVCSSCAKCADVKAAQMPEKTKVG
jgi:hypothetical protein